MLYHKQVKKCEQLSTRRPSGHTVRTCGRLSALSSSVEALKIKLLKKINCSPGWENAASPDVCVYRLK